MNRVSTVIIAAVMMGFGVTSLVLAASVDTPEINFYLDQELVSTRYMTSTEFTKWQELQKASHGIRTTVMPTAELGEGIADQALNIAGLGLKVAANALEKFAGNGSEEDFEHKLKLLTDDLELRTEVIEQQADNIEQYAKLVEQSADEFRHELQRESSAIRFDRVQIEDQQSVSSIDFN